jgi:hypothetical protein
MITWSSRSLDERHPHSGARVWLVSLFLHDMTSLALGVASTPRLHRPKVHTARQALVRTRVAAPSNGRRWSARWVENRCAPASSEGRKRTNNSRAMLGDACHCSPCGRFPVDKRAFSEGVVQCDGRVQRTSRASMGVVGRGRAHPQLDAMDSLREGAGSHPARRDSRLQVSSGGTQLDDRSRCRPLAVRSLLACRGFDGCS